MSLRETLLMLLVFAVAACGALGAINRAPAETTYGPTVEFDCPATDSVFTYNIISRVTLRPNEFRILGRENFACAMHSSTYGDYKWIGGIVPYFNQDDELSAGLAHKLWPLHVGKHVEIQNPWFRMDFDVLGFGRVDVPLGRYEAFEIRKSFWTHECKMVTTLYWSPHFKWVIKQEEHMVFGAPPRGLNNWALETVSLPSGHHANNSI